MSIQHLQDGKCWSQSFQGLQIPNQTPPPSGELPSVAGVLLRLLIAAYEKKLREASHEDACVGSSKCTIASLPTCTEDDVRPGEFCREIVYYILFVFVRCSFCFSSHKVIFRVDYLGLPMNSSY